MRDVAGAAAPAAPSTRRGTPGLIDLSDVCFAYAASPPVLSGLDLTVLPGEFVAVAGGSASGKSTLGRIVAGLLPPAAGRVAAGLRIGYVDQNPCLAGGPLRAALTLWNPDMPDVTLEQALVDAEAWDFVQARPGGLDGRVGDGGGGFSGGEQLRLALARALATEPDVLVLDDTASALDEDTVARMFERLRRRGLTLLLLTSSTAVWPWIDRMVLLRDGALADLAGPSTAGSPALADLPSA